MEDKRYGNVTCNGEIELEKEKEIDKKKKIKKEKPVKHKYGQYQNVLLSDEEIEKLKNECPNNWEEWIEKVSGYCKSTGKTYSDYLATIRNWKRKEDSKHPKPVPKVTEMNPQEIDLSKLTESEWKELYNEGKVTMEDYYRYHE